MYAPATQYAWLTIQIRVKEKLCAFIHTCTSTSVCCCCYFFFQIILVMFYRLKAIEYIEIVASHVQLCMRSKQIDMINASCCTRFHRVRTSIRSHPKPIQYIRWLFVKRWIDTLVSYTIKRYNEYRALLCWNIAMTLFFRRKVNWSTLLSKW